jgi:putative transposase
MRCHILPFAEEGAKIRLMFMDEAGFGRINDLSACWAKMGTRPVVSSLRVREYMQVYGAVDPVEGGSSFIIAPKCNTDWTNEFLNVLSINFKDDYILLASDNASWHKSKDLKIPDNIRMFYIPPRTPEMNPIEQLWREIRKDGFKNVFFKTLDMVVEKLCDVLSTLSKETVKSVTGRDWINGCFYLE